MTYKNQFSAARIFVAGLLLLLALPASAQQSPVGIWETSLRTAFFGDREILEAGDFLNIDAPKRAENPAVVPIKLTTGFDQSGDKSIKSITLIVDKNPDPKAGVFHFSKASGKADLELRLRVDQYSHIRAIAETNDGKLYMASRFVKGSGGCSAPAAADLELAMARLGKMQLRTKPAASGEQNSLLATQLKISHPNITGMQKNQVTHLYMPAHYVRKVNVKLAGETIFSADMGISISENPTFEFYLRPQDKTAKLVAEVIDSKENLFSKETEVTVISNDS